MTLPPLFYTPIARDLLLVTGRDRQTFLQGMLSNDIVRLQKGESCYAFVLDATAHVLADVHVLNVGDALLLDVEPGMAEFVKETLEKYLIMERVRIARRNEHCSMLAIGGVGLGDVLEHFRIANPERFLDGVEGANVEITAYDPGGRYDVLAVKSRAIVPLCFVYGSDLTNTDQQPMAVLRIHDAVELPIETLEALRIEAGIPKFGVDIDRSVLAPETGQKARAISYRKGCYIGQEIVARIDARGHTNRGFVGFRLDPATETLPAHNTPVFVDEKEVGRITSAVVSPTLNVPIALGYLRNEHATTGTNIRVGAPDGAVAQVAALPFVTSETADENGSPR